MIELKVIEEAAALSGTAAKAVKALQALDFGKPTKVKPQGSRFTCELPYEAGLLVATTVNDITKALAPLGFVRSPGAGTVSWYIRSPLFLLKISGITGKKYTAILLWEEQ